MSNITEEMLDEFRARYATDREARVLSAAMAKTDMADLAYVPASAALLKGAFPVEDARHNGPAEVRAVLALCRAQYPA